MRVIRLLALASTLALGVTAAAAQVTDPNMTCADYLAMAAKVGPTPKTGNAEMDKAAADLEAKMKAYCTANPKAPAMEAAEKAMTGN